MTHTFGYRTGDPDALKFTAAIMGASGGSSARGFDIAMTVLVNICALAGIDQRETVKEGDITIGSAVDQSLAFLWDTDDGAPAKAVEKNIETLFANDPEFALLIALLNKLSEPAEDADETDDVGS